MISLLRGNVLEKDELSAVLLVGSETSWVGYRVIMPTHSLTAMKEGENLQIFIEANYREDAQDLYGFSTKQERDIFRSLLQVNGVGPKLAIGMMSAVHPQSLVDAILSGDRDRLVAIPGIGKKTAERILIDAKDPLKKRLGDQSLQSSLSDRYSLPEVSVEGEVVAEAMLALITLGFKDPEIRTALNKIRAEDERADPSKLVRAALKLLRRG